MSVQNTSTTPTEILVKQTYPNAVCVLECSTDGIEDWDGPTLYDHRVYEDSTRTVPLSDYWPYPERAWLKVYEKIVENSRVCEPSANGVTCLTHRCYMEMCQPSEAHE